MSRNAFFSLRSKKDFLSHWYCGEKQIEMKFSVVCTLGLVSPKHFEYCDDAYCYRHTKEEKCHAASVLYSPKKVRLSFTSFFEKFSRSQTASQKCYDVFCRFCRLFYFNSGIIQSTSRSIWKYYFVISSSWKTSRYYWRSLLSNVIFFLGSAFFKNSLKKRITLQIGWSVYASFTCTSRDVYTMNFCPFRLKEEFIDWVHS